MAKSMGRPKSDRDDVSVKMDRAVIAKAKKVATHRGMHLAEFLSDLASPIVDRAYLEMLKELEAK